MPIKIQCGACGAALKAPDESQGQSLPCPKCNQQIAVPVTGQLDELEPIAPDYPPQGSPMPSTPAPGFPAPAGQMPQPGMQDPMAFGGAPAPGFGQQPGGVPQQGGFLQPGFQGGFPQGGFGGQQMPPAQFGGYAAPRRKKSGKNGRLILFGAGGLVLIASVIILIVVLTAGGYGHLTYVPADSEYVVHMDVAAMRNSSIFKKFESAAGANNPLTQMQGIVGGAFGPTLDAEGFFNSIDSVTSAGDFAGVNDSIEVIRLNKDYALSEVLSRETLDDARQSSFEGTDIYRISMFVGYVCMPDPRTLLICRSEDFLKDALRSGTDPQFSERTAAILGKADFSSTIVVAAALDRSTRMKAQARAMPFAADAATGAKSVVVEVNLTSDIHISAVLEASSSDAATISQKLNEAVQEAEKQIAMVQTMLQLDGLDEAFDSVSVSASGSDVIASARLPEELLMSLINSSQTMGGLGGGFPGN